MHEDNPPTGCKREGKKVLVKYRNRKNITERSN